MQVVLISTYELGRQPFGLASPAAWLRAAGADVYAVDVSRQRLDERVVEQADLVGFYLPMHTATRLAVPLIGRVRELAPGARLCAFGVYAPLNAAWLRQLGVTDVLGAEGEADLVALARALDPGGAPRYSALRRPGEQTPASLPAAPGFDAHEEPPRGGSRGHRVPRLAFRVPDRRGLPPLDRYARLHLGDDATRVVGYTEASRGCKHLCRHCPIVPVYGGQFRVVPPDVVMADVAQLVEAGARHITFGDPDFFNGIGHARRIVAQLARSFPGVTYDVTIKVEHLVRHAGDLRLLRETGCVFVTSAVESIDDRILERLRKGHTRADAERVVAECRAAGVPLVPTFVPFTPWTTRAGYLELLQWIDDLDLVEQIAPIQLAIRLLLPANAPLLEDPTVREAVGPFEPARLAHQWAHPDRALDVLQRDIEAIVAGSAHEGRRLVFSGVRALASERLGGTPLPSLGGVAGSVRRRSEIPWLDEPWYC